MQTHTPVQSFLEGYSHIRSREGALLGVARFLSWRFKKPTMTISKNRKRIDLDAMEALARDYLKGKYDYAGDPSSTNKPSGRNAIIRTHTRTNARKNMNAFSIPALDPPREYPGKRVFLWEPPGKPIKILVISLPHIREI